MILKSCNGATTEKEEMLMDRTTFIIKCKSGADTLKPCASELRALAEASGVNNFSIWSVDDLLLCYGEAAGSGAAAVCDGIMARLEGAELICAPGTMRLMYHDIGVVRQDKSLIRHRVFCTRLKPGCAEEYKRRHDALIDARGDAVSEGPDSNFTIWHGAGYIFGYDEKVRAFDHEPTEAEKAADIAWETRQLEIMDWLTDDVDWITGQKHPAVRRVV